MWLAIETGYAACSVALISEHGAVASRHELIGRGHVERLVPLVGELLDEAGKPDAILVDVGPGSFTGIRVGIAAARAFGLVWGIPVTGYSSMTLIAVRAFAHAPSAASVTVVMEAGRGEVFAQTFDRMLAAAAPVVAVRRAAAAARAAPAIAGTGAAMLAAAGSRALILDDAPPDAADVWRLPAAFRVLLPTPIYVRAPDAKLPQA